MSGKRWPRRCEHQSVAKILPTLFGKVLGERGPYLVCRGCGAVRMAVGQKPQRLDPDGMKGTAEFGPPLRLSAKEIASHWPEGAGYEVIS